MTLHDIIALSSAGFTKNDILNIASSMANNNPTPIQNPAPAQAPAPAPAPVPAFGQVQGFAQAQGFGQGFQAMNPPTQNDSKLDMILTAIQGNNVFNSQLPPANTPDDMLAAIINPPQKGE